MSVSTPPPQRLEGPVVALGRSRSTSRTLGRGGPAGAAVEGRYARARRYGAPWHRKRWRSYSMGHVLENKKTHMGRAGPQISSNINSSCTVTFHQKDTDTAKVDLSHGTVVETDHGPKMSQVVLSCFTPGQAASQSSLSSIGVSRYEYLYETSFSRTHTITKGQDPDTWVFISN